ncbi:MAG: exosortase/archaeosortase family protein [Myxococcota bacterium]
MASDVNAATSDRRLAVVGIALTTALAVMTFAPILYHMVLHWKQVPDYSHGFLVAPLAIYFAWAQKRKLRRAPVQPSWWGLLPLGLGLLALLVGRLGVELMSMRVGFVLTLHGLVLLLLGLPMYRILAFPLGFLFLMVPLPQSLVNLIAFPLQLGAADLAVSVLHSLDFPVLREGNIIHLPKAQLFVAEACSGLRSLMALGTLGVVLAYFFQKNWVDRVIIVASTIPIAVVINAFRVGLTSILTLRYGMEMAEGVIHQTEGFFTFGLAFALLLLESRLLDIFRRRRSARGKISESPA